MILGLLWGFPFSFLSWCLFVCTLKFSMSSSLHLSPFPLLSFTILSHFSSLPCSLPLFFSLRFGILSNPCRFAKSLTFHSFSNLKPNRANNSLSHLEPCIAVWPFVDAHSTETLLLDSLFSLSVTSHMGVYEGSRCSHKNFHYFLWVNMHERWDETVVTGVKSSRNMVVRKWDPMKTDLRRKRPWFLHFPHLHIPIFHLFKT